MKFNPQSSFFKSVSVLLSLSLCLWTSMDLLAQIQQSSAADHLTAARAYWDQFDTEKAISSLQKALELGLSKPADRFEAHRLLALCYATQRNDKLAQSHFEKCLEINPSFKLPLDQSPVFLDPFGRALQAFADRDPDPPVIEVVPYENALEGSSFTIRVILKDASPIRSAKIFYRATGTGSFTVMDLEKRGDDQYVANFKPETITLRGVEYFIEATDSQGNAPAREGSPSAPLILSVNPKPDEAGPEITHTPLGPSIAGEDLEISASLSDNEGLAGALVFFRNQGDDKYQRINMQSAGSGTYKAVVQGHFIKQGAFQYYIAAADLSQNVSYWKSAEAPHAIPVIAKKKNGGKAVLWVGLIAAAVTAGVLIFGGGGDEEAPAEETILTDPPDWPDA